jgi:hypothetical protein
LNHNPPQIFVPSLGPVQVNKLLHHRTQTPPTYYVNNTLPSMCFVNRHVIDMCFWGKSTCYFTSPFLQLSLPMPYTTLLLCFINTLNSTPGRQIISEPSSPHEYSSCEQIFYWKMSCFGDWHTVFAQHGSTIRHCAYLSYNL